MRKLFHAWAMVCLIVFPGLSSVCEASSHISDCVRSEIFWKLGNSAPSNSDILIYLPNKSGKSSELKTALLARDGKRLSREETGRDIEIRLQNVDGEKRSPVAALVEKFVHSPKGLELLSGYHPSFYLGPSHAKATIRDVSLEVSEGRTELSAVVDLLEVQNKTSRVDLVSKGVGGVSLPSVSAKSALPITVRVPVSVDMSPQGKIGFKLMDLPNVDSSKVTFEMDGAKIPTEKVLELLNETGLVSKVRNQVLDFLNARIADQLGRDLKQTIKIAHPKTGASLLEMELSPQSVTADSKGLTAGISAKINAGGKGSSRPVNFSCPVAGPGTCPEYDAALAVSQPLIQNLVGQLFDSGAMRGIIAGQRSVSVIEPPKIQYLPSPSHGTKQDPAAYVKIGLRVKPDQLSGVEGMVLNDKFSIRTEVSLKVAPSIDGKGLEVHVLNAKAEKYAIDEAGLRSPMRLLSKLAAFAPSVVAETMQNVVTEAINTKLRNLASLPPVRLPLPQRALDQIGSLKIVGVQFDENNNLYFLFK